MMALAFEPLLFAKRAPELRTAPALDLPPSAGEGDHAQRGEGGL